MKFQLCLSPAVIFSTHTQKVARALLPICAVEIRESPKLSIPWLLCCAVKMSSLSAFFFLPNNPSEDQIADSNSSKSPDRTSGHRLVQHLDQFIARHARLIQKCEMPSDSIFPPLLDCFPNCLLIFATPSSAFVFSHVMVRNPLIWAAPL